MASELVERQVAEVRRRVQAGELDLRDIGKQLIGFWDQDFPAALLEAAAALKEAEAETKRQNELARHYCEQHLLAVGELTAARAEIERLKEGLWPALDHDQWEILAGAINRWDRGERDADYTLGIVNYGFVRLVEAKMAARALLDQADRMAT